MYVRDRTVLHGFDQAGAIANRPKFPGNGHQYYADDMRQPFVFDSRRGLYMPASSGPAYHAAGNFLVDLFDGPVLRTDIWNVNSGDDAEAADPVITPATGKLTMVSGNAGTGVTHDQSGITSATFLSPEDGLSRFLFIGQVSAITAVRLYMGLTDLTTVEEPFSLSGTTLTSTCTDGCGFLFDTEATTDNWWCVGTAGGTDTTHVNVGSAPVAATDFELLIELSAAGVAKFYYNETLVATMADAVAVDSDLCAVAYIVPTSTTARTLTSSGIALQQV